MDKDVKQTEETTTTTTVEETKPNPADKAADEVLQEETVKEEGD